LESSKIENLTAVGLLKYLLTDCVQQEEVVVNNLTVSSGQIVGNAGEWRSPSVFGGGTPFP